MLSWSIRAAIESGVFSRVLVSTDSESIAEVARSFGADVPFLRNSAADDCASSSEATLVALAQAEEHWGDDYQIVGQLMANCPMRSSKDTKNAFKSFVESGAPAQISSFRFGWMNPWWAARLDEAKCPEWLFPEARSLRSQDLPHLYCPSGAIWLALKSELVKHQTFYVPRHIFYEMSWISALDIDDEADLKMAMTCMSIVESGGYSLS